MARATKTSNAYAACASHGILPGTAPGRSAGKSAAHNSRCALLLLLVAVGLAGREAAARPQSPSDSAAADAIPSSTASRPSDPSYFRPTQRTTATNYLFDAFGPYPAFGAAIAAALDQSRKAPPEWKQGFDGYSKRFGSDFGMAAVSTTTRYALAGILREDTQYYRCECSGALPRFRHAVLATVTARRGAEGHRIFSIPAMAAPYAGSMTAVYGWYPNRFGAKDAFRIGNYTLLASVGGNIAQEFLYGGRHSLLSRVHLHHAHGAADPGSQQ